MNDNSGVYAGTGAFRADPALRDALAQASFLYDQALLAYEDALAAHDGARRADQAQRLSRATRGLAAAQAALTARRISDAGEPSGGRGRAAGPSFDQLLSDHTQQLDPTGAVLESILRYQVAPQAAASASRSLPPTAPVEVRAAEYVRHRLDASTVASTVGRIAAAG